MAKNDAAALRAKRLRRIEARKKAQLQSNNNVNSDEQKTAKAQRSQENAPASATPEVLTAAVLDPSSIDRTANVDLLLYEDKDPFWVVLANGRPVAEVRLSDQEEPQKVAKMFVTEQYAEGVREAAKQFPFHEVLAGVRARTYQASVSGDDAYRSIEAAVKSETEQKLRQAKANLRDDMLNTLNLVVLAQTKNFLRENPLKDELYQRMTQAGLDEKRSVALIEAAFQARGSEHFETCFKQATKWMDLSIEARAELEEQIKDLGYRNPDVPVSDEIRSASAAPVPQGVHNVPLQTRPVVAHSTEASDDEKEKIREAFGFRHRNLNHSMPNR